MHIKICGITNIHQALVAAEAGADMLGFNFYPLSPRFISLAACTHIMQELRNHGHATTGVGVFVNEKVTKIQAILDACGLDLAQLAGDEPAADLRTLGEKAFKAVRPATVAEADQALRDFGRRSAPALLVDARVAGSYGGSGHLADWTIARYLAERAPILLAGGLHPGNVAAAIRAVQPWGVDVASGVETAPGIKTSALINAFVTAARTTPAEHA